MSHPAPAVQAPQSNDQSLQQQKVQQAQRNGMMPMMPVQHMQPQFIPAQQPVDGDQKYYAAAPVYGQPAPQQPQPTDPQYGSRVLKISANSNPKNVAGAISHITRQGDCPAMLATGSASINQAIKAVAIARGYLEENKIELTCYPEFRSDKRTGLSLVLNKSVRRSPSTGNEESDKDVQQLKVSKGSNPNSVAGAIANKLRAGQRVWLLAIGADCVTHAVKSVAIGRKYLERDGMDISFRPEFTKVKFEDGRDCSALKFVILSQQVTPIADLVDIHPPQ